MSMTTMTTRKPNEQKQQAAKLLLESEEGLPVWVRAPARGLEPHTGLSRGRLYALYRDGLVRTASLRPRGAVRGVRLFHLRSLLDYIAGCEESRAGSADTTGHQA